MADNPRKNPFDGFSGEQETEKSRENMRAEAMARLAANPQDKLAEAMILFSTPPSEMENLHTKQQEDSLLYEMALSVDSLFVDIIDEFCKLIIKVYSKESKTSACSTYRNKKLFRIFFDTLAELYSKSPIPQKDWWANSIEQAENETVSMREFRNKVLKLIDKKISSKTFYEICSKNGSDLIKQKDYYNERFLLYGDLIKCAFDRIFIDEIMGNIECINSQKIKTQK